MPHGDLVDIGAILAIVDTRDRWHPACLGAAASLRLPLVATISVLTETFHFAAKRGIVQRTWEFVRRAPIRLAAISDAELPAIEALMHHYADGPMDFADATLVHVAEREGLRTILTVDHRDLSHWTPRQVPDITGPLSPTAPSARCAAQREAGAGLCRKGT